MSRHTRPIAAVPETPVRMRVNGLAVSTWTCTPHGLEALGAGRLVSLGFARSSSEILALRTLPKTDGILGIDAEVEAARAAVAIEEREHRASHGCGLRFFLDCRPQLITRPDLPLPGDGAAHPDPDIFAGLFRELYERAEAYRDTGGLHTAGLSDGTRLRFLHEEVARHNAVDKAIGDAVLEEAPLTKLGLVTTARISAEIALKATRAGLAWIASRSVPTTLAVEIAGAAGVPIIARAARPESRVFVPGEA